MDVRAVRQQDADDVGVGLVVAGRHHQRRLAAPAVPRVRVGPVRQEQRDGPRAAAAGRRHQRRLPRSERERVRVGAGVQEEAEEAGEGEEADLIGRAPLGRAPLGRQPQRSGAVAVGRIHVGAGPHEQARRLHVVPVHRPVQRGRAVGRRRVDVGPLLDERPQARAVALLGRLRHRRVAPVPRDAARDAASDAAPGGAQAQHRQHYDEPSPPIVA